MAKKMQYKELPIMWRVEPDKNLLIKNKLKKKQIEIPEYCFTDESSGGKTYTFQ